MAKEYTISLFLTEKDTAIIDWLNMLRRYGEEQAVWVKAVIVAYFANQPLDTGIVGKQEKKRNPQNQYFGDDTETKPQIIKVTQGRRTEKNEVAVGTVFSFHIAEQEELVAYLMKDVIEGKRKTSRLIKAILRNYIQQGEREQPPKTKNVQDIFELYDKFFPGFKRRKKTDTFNIVQDKKTAQPAKKETKTRLVQKEIPPTVEGVKKKHPFLKMIT